jgi:aminopeptidase-like protein
MEEIDKLLRRLFPICRSLAGRGTVETLSILKEYIPLEIREIPSGTRVYDWTVPKEWNIENAYIKGPDGKKFADFKENNLHVMGYSVPVHAKMPLSELKPHLHSLPSEPDLIPYHTSYYHENWGFCIADRELRKLRDGEYEVVLDSSLEDGKLRYGEFYLPGETKDEILLSSYICHPSMANDNTSGIVLGVFLARALQSQESRRYSYRFLFAPETIGALAWLSKNEKHLPRIKHGLVITCVGDSGRFNYKKSRQGTAEIDRAAEKMLLDSGEPFLIIDFVPTGSDERQFCSPGFNLPVGSLMRTQYLKFRQYHTSGDDLSLVSADSIAGSLGKYLALIAILEKNRYYQNLNPKGEVMLSKHGLYSKSSPSYRTDAEMARLWVLNQSDGSKSLLDIACKSQMKFMAIAEAAYELHSAKLIKIINP